MPLTDLASNLLPCRQTSSRSHHSAARYLKGWCKSSVCKEMASSTGCPLLLETLQAAKIPSPSIRLFHCLLGYTTNGAWDGTKLGCSAWTSKRTRARYFCLALLESSASQRNITWGHVWLQGTSPSMPIPPAKPSSASALLYEYLNDVQSTSNMSCLSIFACIL